MIKTVFITAVLFVTTFSIAQADVVSLIDTDDVPNSEEGVLRPVRGISMNKVKQQFGEPEQTTAAVGQPPITTWTYPNFKVYFEYQHVIFSVLPPKK